MKKYISILATAIIAASCSLFDNAIESPSQSTYADDVVFSNYTLAEYSVYGIGEIVSHTNSYRDLQLQFGRHRRLRARCSGRPYPHERIQFHSQ